MTVKELINQLQEVDQDLVVVTIGGDDSCQPCDYYEIDEVLPGKYKKLQNIVGLHEGYRAFPHKQLLILQ